MGSEEVFLNVGSKRYVKANNPNLENYDKSKPQSYLAYFDANNLYGWALSRSLPYRNFEWVPNTTFQDLDAWKTIIEEYSDNSKQGWIFEVSLRYPKKYHDLHRDLPLAPEHLNQKLCTTLRDKVKYIIHVENLKLYTELGLEIEKIHRVIKFDQKPFMKPYT